jgi:glycosyltransferase involved in cell wall biosynthesis
MTSPESVVPPATLVVVPVWNARDRVVEVVNDLLGHSLDVLVVDDGSDDGTAQVLERGAVRNLRHSANLGLGAAYKSAIGYAVRNGYGQIITIDGDGQYAADDAARLAAEPCEPAWGLTLGQRFRLNVAEMPPEKVAVHLMGSLLYRIMAGRHCLDAACGLRRFPVTAEMLTYDSNSYGFLFEQVIRWMAGGRPIRYIDIKSTYLPGRVPVTRSRTLADFFRALLLGAHATADAMRAVRAYRELAAARRDFAVRFGVGAFVCRIHSATDGYLVDCDLDWARRLIDEINKGTDVTTHLLAPASRDDVG